MIFFKKDLPFLASSMSEDEAVLGLGLLRDGDEVEDGEAGDLALAAEADVLLINRLNVLFPASLPGDSVVLLAFVSDEELPSNDGDSEVLRLEGDFLLRLNRSETLIEEVLRGGTGTSFESLNSAADFLLERRTEAGIVARPAPPRTNVELGVVELVEERIDDVREKEEDDDDDVGVVDFALGVTLEDV